MTELAEKMIRYRAKHRLSQRDFAKLCGLSSQTINNVETGIADPSKITVLKIQLAMEEEKED